MLFHREAPDLCLVSWGTWGELCWRRVALSASSFPVHATQ